MSAVESVRWSADGSAVDIIDQRLLPGVLVRRELRTVEDVCDAILSLAVRGAPAIGVAGAMGLVVSLAQEGAEDRERLLARAAALGERIARVRPTAVNLSWAIDRMLRVARAAAGDPPAVLDALRREATRILDEDREMCRRIGEHGLALLGDGARVLTHCNAGALATAGIGTALAPVYLAAERGRRIAVFADETRPLLQGSRLTAWELSQAGIDVTVLADNMAASLMRAGGVDVVIVGADRIAANGDVANKIGTYPLALAARHHDVPFYVAAPWSTVDPATATGDAIVIEHRAPDELGRGFDAPVAPRGVAVYNPAFDVTPAELVTAFITDRGVLRPPYRFGDAGHAARAAG
jgi:methylthioribose-1-phosphate isomerase